MAPKENDGNGNGNEATALTAPKTSEAKGPLATLMKYVEDPNTKQRLSDMLGQRAGAFSNSIINVVKSSRELQKIAMVNPASIMTAAMVAASVNLPIDPSLGFAAIVPYGGKNPAAQFQLMYKGLIQLAQRSGAYRTMHEAVVYKDELKSYNPITGAIEFTEMDTWKMRYASAQKLDDVAGFFFSFKLVSGFEMSRFISFDEAMAHGRRYSKAFQADLEYNKQAALWSTDPLVMGLKTIIKMTLGKYGILSIEMQDALVADNADFAGDPKHVDSRTIEDPEIGGVEGLKQRMETEQREDEAEASAPSEVEKPGLYTCTACGWTGDTVARAGKCPACGATKDKVAATAGLKPDDDFPEAPGDLPSKWVCGRNPDHHVYDEPTPNGKCPKCMGIVREVVPQKV